MPKGNMLAQAMHAAIDYCMKHSPQDWWSQSNTLVVMEVADEQAILAMEQKAIQKGIKYALFREPAMGDMATAIALDPDDENSRRITGGIRLAMRD